MLSNLCADFMQVIQDNLVLCIVLGVIAVLIVAILVALIVLQTKANKLAKECKAAEAEEAPAEEAAEEAPAEEAPAEAEAEEAPAEETAEEAPAEEAPAEETTEETAEETPAEAEGSGSNEEVKEESDMKKEEPKPAAKKESRSPYVFKEAPKKAEPAPAPAPEKSGANGKWVIEKQNGRFWLSLYAPNGQVMLESPAPGYSTISSARSGIKTYQDNIANADRLQITQHKNGDFQVVVLNARNGLLATSSTYSSRSQAESAKSSIQRWAQTTTVEESTDEE